MITVLAGCATLPPASGPLHITHVREGLDSPIHPYSEQATRGFELGLEYATDGTFRIGERTLQFHVRDIGPSSDAAVAAVDAAVREDGAEILIGPLAFLGANAVLETAERHGAVLFVQSPMVTLPGAAQNPFVFRVGHRFLDDMRADADAAARPGITIQTVTMDTALGEAAIGAYRERARALGAYFMAEEYLPTNYSSSFADRIRARIAERPGAHHVYLLPLLLPNPVGMLRDAGVGFQASFSLGGATPLPALLTRFKQEFVGMLGTTTYYHAFPRNPANEWLVEEYLRRHGQPPDWYAAEGFNTALTLVAGLELSKGHAGPHLIDQLEGLEVETAVGTIHLRAADHQALQDRYIVRYVEVPGVNHAVPELVRVLPRHAQAYPVTRP